MADVIDSDEIVTKFLVNTFRVHSGLKYDAIQALNHCAVFATHSVSSDDDGTFEFIPLITGSVAEFYIEPMLSCVGDVDIMYHSRRQLAIPAGTAPPTQLSDVTLPRGCLLLSCTLNVLK